jgi:hypothetical protein
MSEIVTVKGEQYLIKDGVAYPIKAGNEHPQQEKPQKRKEISPNEKVNLLKSMNKQQVIEWFGELNKKQPLSISANGFWKLYQMPKGKNHYFTHAEKRLYILPQQIKALNLGKKAKAEVYINARNQLEQKRINWEKSDRGDIAIANAVDSLTREMDAFNTMIHGA